MRRVFILRESAEDSLLCDDLPEPIDLDEMQNPECPECGASTLLAYLHDGEYTIITWDFTDEEEALQPQDWFLICHNGTCDYEEQVERVYHPAGAILFDLHWSTMDLDEETGLHSQSPADVSEFITYLEKCKEIHSHRKLDAFLEEARWRYEEELKRRRNWVKQLQPEHQVDFYIEDGWKLVSFIAGSEEAIIVRTVPEGQILALSLVELAAFHDPPFTPKANSAVKRGGLIMIWPEKDWVVAKGYHLWLQEVDRLGQFYVGTQNPEAAAALALTCRGQGYWAGTLLRRDVQERYTIRKMARVKGHWVVVWGQSEKGKRYHVRTEDAAVAKTLGLKLQERPQWDQHGVNRWVGSFPHSQVEEWKELRTYQWPIPELK